MALTDDFQQAPQILPTADPAPPVDGPGAPPEAELLPTTDWEPPVYGPAAPPEPEEDGWPRPQPDRRNGRLVLGGCIAVMALIAALVVTQKRPEKGIPLGTIVDRATALATPSPPVVQAPTARAVAAPVVGGLDPLGDAGPATKALLVDPSGVAADGFGTIYVADRGTGRVRRIGTDGRISTVLGGAAARTQTLRLVSPEQLSVDLSGSVYVADSALDRVVRLDPSGAAELVASADLGTGSAVGTDSAGADSAGADSALGTDTAIRRPIAVAAGSDGRVAVLSADQSRIDIVDTASGRVSTLTPDGLVNPQAILPVGTGGWLIADSGTGQLLQVGPDGTVGTVASVDADPNVATLPGAPTAVSVLPGGLLAVACDGVDGVVVIRPGKAQPVAIWAAGAGDDGVRPQALFLAADGRLLVADGRAKRIVRIDPATPDNLELIAGSGPWQPAPTATGIDLPLRRPSSVAAAPNGGAWVADPPADRVWLIGADGRASVAAGDGRRGRSADGATAAASPLDRPTHLAAGLSGDLYVAEAGAQRVVRIQTDGAMSTVIGAPGANPAGFRVGPMAVAPDGTLVIAEAAGRLVRVAPDGTVTSIVNPVQHVVALAVTADGTVLEADGLTNELMRVTGRRATPVAAGVGDPLLGGGRGSSTALGVNPDQLTAISGVAAGPSGIVVADQWADRLALVSPTGVVARFNGSVPEAITASPLSQRLRRPSQVTLEADGGALVLLSDQRLVRRMRADGTVETIAGSGEDGSSADGPIARTTLAQPAGLAARGAHLVVAETGHHRVRSVAPDGVSTIAGSGAQGNVAPDASGALAAQLDSPRGVAVDGERTIVADTANHRVVEVSASGRVTVIAGTGRPGVGSPIGPATQVPLFRPSAVAVAGGLVYIADTGNDRVLRIARDGTIRLMASVAQPSGLAARADGSVVVTSTGDHQVRAIAPDASMRIIAGLGVAGNTGDGGSAEQSRLDSPVGIAVGPDGSMWICDTGNNSVRRITPEGTIVTVADSTSGITGPVGIVVDPSFGMVISDSTDRMLQITPPELDRVASGWSVSRSGATP